MKKNKLFLSRETLRNLEPQSAAGAEGLSLLGDMRSLTSTAVL